MGRHLCRFHGTTLTAGLLLERPTLYFLFFHFFRFTELNQSFILCCHHFLLQVAANQKFRLLFRICITIRSYSLILSSITVSRPYGGAQGLLRALLSLAHTTTLVRWESRMEHYTDSNSPKDSVLHMDKTKPERQNHSEPSFISQLHFDHPGIYQKARLIFLNYLLASAFHSL